MRLEGKVFPPPALFRVGPLMFLHLYGDPQQDTCSPLVQYSFSVTFLPPLEYNLIV